jgi:hypothetical protein
MFKFFSHGILHVIVTQATSYYKALVYIPYLPDCETTPLLKELKGKNDVISFPD